MKFKWEKKHNYYLLIAVSISILIIILQTQFDTFLKLDLAAADFMFYLRDDRPAEGMVKSRNPALNENIIIVGIDEKSIRKYGKWPWSRKIFASLLERLSSANTSAVFFDIMFTEYTNTNCPCDPQDKFFFNSLGAYSKKNNNVFSCFPLEKNKNEIDISENTGKSSLQDKFSFPVPAGFENIRPYMHAAPPVPEIIEKMKGIGHTLMEEDIDSKYRRVPLFVKYNNRLYPHAVTLIAMNYYKINNTDVEIVPGRYVKFKNAKIVMGDKEKFTAPEDNKDITGDISIPVDNECKMIVNYRGWPGEFIAQAQYISFNDIFNVPAEYFNGKIILIGAYAHGIAYDIWPSPHGLMFGIEHNASALNTVLQRDFLFHIPSSVNALLLILASVIIGFIVPRIKIWQNIIFIILLALLILAVSFYVFTTYNVIFSSASASVSILFSFIGTVIYRNLTEEKEKRFIRARFEKYVSHNVVEELLKNPKDLKLGGEDREITVFFSDIRNFTTISDRIGEPQKVVELINEYLSSMTGIILEYNGTLDKYVGDGIMAFWNAPVTQKDHAILACKAAIAQIRYLNEILLPKWEREGKPGLNIGIGINTGIMTVGNVGSDARMDYTVMGPEVNLGARLESANKKYGTSIIIGESTYLLVRDAVIVNDLGTTEVKGINRPIRLYELIKMK